MRKAKKLLVLLLTIAMLASLAVPALAANGETLASVTNVTGKTAPVARAEKGTAQVSAAASAAKTSAYDDSDIVPVIIKLEGTPAIDVQLSGGISAMAASEQTASALKTSQQTFAQAAGKAGVRLAVNYSYTALMNGVGATVRYGDIEKLRAMDGVLGVWVANTYNLPDTQTPSMAFANATTGAQAMWGMGSGYKGQGIVTAVLDTGLNTTHEAFADTSLITAPALSESFAKGFAAARGGTYLSAKVPFAYDYADKDGNVTDNQGHGTHVSGTVCGYAVNGEGAVTFSGAAPAAQLLSMKIFSDQNATTNSTIYFAALDDAYKLGADVINMSIGSPGGFTFDSELETEVFGNIYKKLDDAGVIVCVAAGNENSMGENSRNDYGLPTADYADYGVVGSPSTYVGNLSVASVENTNYPAYTITVGSDNYEYIDNGPAGKTILSLIIGNVPTEYDYVMVPGTGKAADYAGLDLTGKIAVIQRGDITFTEKVKNAADYHAIGAIIYNNRPGSIGMQVDGQTIPAVSVTQDAGAAMNAATAKKLTINNTMSVVANPSAGQMSTFSSWGCTPDLKLKPQITAPGGMIYSSLIGSNNAYASMSGTSMATPNTTGCMALLTQYLRSRFTGKTKVEVANMAEALTESTARIAKDSSNNTYSPRKQGAGVIDLSAAVNAKAYITSPIVNTSSSTAGAYTISFTVSNLTNANVTYNTETLVLCDMPFVETDNGGVPTGNVFNTQTSSAAVAGVDYTLTGGGTVTVPASGTAEVSIALQLKGAAIAKMTSVFTNGFFVEGYVTLTESTAVAAPLNTGEQIHATYMGFCGDWTAAGALEANDWGDLLDGYAWMHENGYDNYIKAGYSPLDVGLLSGVNVGVNEVAAPYTDAAGKTKYPYLGDNAFGYAYHVDARNAITTSTGVGSQNYIYALPMQLRNAKALGVEVVDSADNSVVYYSQYDSYIPKAAYDANQGMYLSYASYMWDGKNYSGSEPAELPNNTEVTVKINATLDCAGAADKRTEWSFPVTIDGENPVAGNVVWNYVKPQTMTLELSDNQYLMGAFVYDLDDTGAPANFYLSKTYASDAKTDKTLADTSSETVDLTGADTSKPLYIEVYDYAGNASVYEVSFVNAPSIPSNPGTTVKYTVTAAAGAGGSVSPASSSVSAGGSVTVTITPDNGYEIAKVMVDGVSVGAVSSYTFSNVDKDHILNATFRRGQTALEWVSPFVDVKSGDWFYGAVADVVSSGLMDGISASEFAPSADTSRAMVITVLYRMYGEPGVTGTTSFTDVEAGSWYEKAVVWGVQNKIVKGVSDTSFAPFASVTRQELAAFLYRYAQFTGRDTAARVDLAARFADASRVADWAADAMSWAVASGIITGTGTGLDPEGSAVRAQFAAMISRY